MSGTANNSFAEKIRHLRARTLAVYHLINSSSVTGEFFGVQGIDSERTVRRTGQIDYVTQGPTNPNSVQQGCACTITCESVGPVNNLQVVGADYIDPIWSIFVTWDPVINATGYSFTSTDPNATFELTSSMSATIFSELNEFDFTITAFNSCSSSSGTATVNVCFLGGSLVRMANGTDKAIENVVVGDLVVGAFGEINTVLALQPSKVGFKKIININGEHRSTENHPHIGPNREFFSANVATLEQKTYGRAYNVIDGDGNTISMTMHGLKSGRVKKLEVGTVLQKLDGPRTVDSIEYIPVNPDENLYHLVVGGSHTYNVDGYAVTGWAHELDFDYDTWTPKIII